MNDQPNIVIIMADDLGFGDIGAYNYGATQTPAIDSLATDGTSMTQHYSASPICAPARAAFLTGRYPQRSGVIDTFPHLELDRLSLDERTLGDHLQDAGYVTGLVGKWHSGALGAAYHPNNRGFDEFVGFRGGGQDYWDWVLDRNGRRESADGRYLTDVFTAEALSFIRRHQDDPFLLYVSYTAPHGPFQAKPEDMEGIADRDGIPDTVNTIAGMVRALDRGVGEILEMLEALQLTENTLILFTSDNGPWMRPGSFSERTVRYNLGLAGGKELVNEGGIRVPLFIRWPGVVAAGRIMHDFAHYTDWVPTLLRAIGKPDSARLPGDGTDLWPAIVDGSAPTLSTRFWQWSRYRPFANINAAVRDGNWKLLYPAIDEVLQIREIDRDQERALRANPQTYRLPASVTVPEYEPEPVAPRPQLYDVLADPGERLDLYVDRPAVAAQLEAKLASWFEEVEFERNSLDTA